MFQLKRNEANPILRPHPDLTWESEGVFNPGVTQRINPEGGEREVVMLYRAVGERESYISHIGLATSKDGVRFERYVKKDAAGKAISDSAGTVAAFGEHEPLPGPVFGPSNAYDKWATEDFRITPIGNDFYITYVAVPDRIMDNGKSIARILPLETSTALLRTRDFLAFEPLGIISPPRSDNKDIVLFPRKIKVDNTEKYYMLHRPNRWSKDWFAGEYAKAVDVPLPACAPRPEDLPTLPSIWIASSDDLIHWDHHHLLLSPSHAMDAKIGPGMPPIETPDGWLMIYHHVDQMENPKRFRYSIRVALLDLNDPTKIIGKLPYDILAPTESYEMENGSQIAFPTGGFIQGDELFVYYGASDLSVCLATGSASELLAELRKEGIGGKTHHETA